MERVINVLRKIANVIDLREVREIAASVGMLCCLVGCLLLTIKTEYFYGILSIVFGLSTTLWHLKKMPHLKHEQSVEEVNVFKYFKGLNR